MNTTDKTQNNSDHVSPAVDIMERLWDAKVVIFLALTAIMFRGCYYNNPETAVPSEMVATPNKVYKTKNEVIGKTVTIRSKPLQKVGLSSFTVSDNQFLGNKPVVVINASGVPFDLPAEQNTKIEVTGQVRNLVIPQIERKFNLRLQEKDYKNYINQPAIIAQSIAVAPEVSQITQNPRQYYGKRVALMGKVENIQSPVLFALDNNQLSGTKELLILLKATPTAAITQGKTVVLTGVVRPFKVSDIARDYNLNWNLQVKRQIEATYGGKPVLAAQVVYPSL